MKKEEIIALESKGVNHKRIEALSKSLKEYSELKNELKNMQNIILKQDEEIELLNKKIKKLERKKLLKGLI